MIKASIITIGDELLIGQIIDTNAAWISQRLNEYGIDIVGKYSVGDDKLAMTNLLNDVSKSCDIILMTGGLGPTKDDITKTALIEFFEDELVFSEETYDKLASMFRSRGKEPGGAHKIQCYLPSQATLFQNPKGTAPAMMMKTRDLTLFSMPGVPYEMKALMEESVLPYISENFEKENIIHQTILTGGIGESSLAEMIQDIEEELPEDISLAYLPSLGMVRLRLTGKGNNDHIKSQIQHFTDKISHRIGDKVWGYGEQTIVQAIAEISNHKNLKIATAESCTGGNIARTIVKQAGSSSFFEGGAVVYSNRLKHQLLGVSNDTLDTFGAVSEEVVKEMAKGAVDRLDVDVAISISGIAGPDGGTEEKPVGTIWIGISDGKTTEATLLKGMKNRDMNIEYATNRALLTLHDFIKNK